MTNSILGRSNYAFGPCNVYWDTESGGDNLSLGTSDQVTVTIGMTKIELRDAQHGDVPADRAVSGQTCQISLGMAQATLERLEKAVQGVTLVRDTADTVTQFVLSDKLSERDSAIQKQLTIIDIVAGVESTEPLDTINFYKVAPFSESIELTYDATGQRYVQVVFNCYKDDDHLDANGSATFFGSEVVV